MKRAVTVRRVGRASYQVHCREGGHVVEGADVEGAVTAYRLARKWAGPHGTVRWVVRKGRL